MPRLRSRCCASTGNRRCRLSNVCELLDSVLTLHQGRVVSLHVEVVRRYAEDVRLFCFAGEVRQLFANLIGNALDAMTPGGGRLLLRVRRARVHGQPGVRVTVADTGSGITAEVRRHIFEPFFTTKEATGTGLGLWVSCGDRRQASWNDSGAQSRCGRKREQRNRLHGLLPVGIRKMQLPRRNKHWTALK